MKSGKALLWKEWREIRWFLVAGAAIFICWPLLVAVGNYRLGKGFYSADMPEMMALLLGGPFAILVAVGVTCRDLQENIACFWQSRPVAIWRWVITKYLVGLAVVLMMLCVPLVMKIFVMKAERELGQLSSILTCHTFTVILIYSISFLAGCLIRMPVYAVIMSVALALLVYFLPILAPPLESSSVFNIMIQSPVAVVQLSKSAQGEPWIAEKMRVVKIPWANDLALRYNIDLLRYIAFALVGSFAAVVLSGVAVKRNWRLKVGQKLMFWLLGGVGMLLFLTVVFQLRSNLECVRQIPIKTVKPLRERDLGIVTIVSDGDKGVVLRRVLQTDESSTPRDEYRLWRFDLSSAEPIGKEIVLPMLELPPMISWSHNKGIAWSAEHPQLLYMVRELHSQDKTDGKSKLNCAEILTISLSDSEAVVTDKIDLLPHIEDRKGYCNGMCIYKDRVFVNLSGQVFIFDLGADGKLTFKSVTKRQVGVYDKVTRRDASRHTFATMLVGLIPAEGLTTEEQLKVAVELTDYPEIASEGDIIIVADNDSPIRVYRLKEIRDDVATLEMAGFRRPTPLEGFVGTYPSRVFVRDGLTYVLWGFGRGLTVYDVRQPQQIRRVGHYAVPNERLQTIAPLPDGNILVGGSKLHIVRPPRHTSWRARTNKDGETVGK
jgi:hypothetical protein